MGLEAGVYLYHKMTPPPNLGHFWVVFEGHMSAVCLSGYATAYCLLVELTRCRYVWREYVYLK